MTWFCLQRSLNVPRLEHLAKLERKCTDYREINHLVLDRIVDLRCAFKPLSKLIQHMIPFVMVSTSSVRLTLATKYNVINANVNATFLDIIGT